MSKYRAIPTEVDGVRFASKAEARRYGQLKLLQASGEIRDLALQPRYPLAVKGQKVATYIADFAYTDRLTGKFIVEDVKSAPTATPLYKLKKKLVKAIYGIDIMEVRNP